MEETMEKKNVFRIAFIATLVALICFLIMGFGIPKTASIASLQPSDIAVQESEFVRPTNEVPALVLRFFAAGSLFVLCGILLYLGMYTAVVERNRLFACVGLGVGLVTVLQDATENAFFINYAMLSLNGVPLTEPALPLIYILANLKIMGSYAGFFIFGFACPRDSKLGWVLSSLMLLYPLSGVLGIAITNLRLLPGVILLLCLPLFAWYFWQQARRA